MTQKNSTFLLLVCIIVPISIYTAHGQDAGFIGGRTTIRGEIIDATPEQNPIEGVTVKIVNSAYGQEYIVTTDKDGLYEKTGLPEGRYTISASKKGYQNRFGKSKNVADGGEIFDRIRMRKQKSFFTYFFEFNGHLTILLAIPFILCMLGFGYLIYFFYIESRK
ncbi:MAG: carboxypeptidase-like regulatory domain-containing protein [Candidatus Poribacteria bacterium]|nr:carboxypeptidase-like regulatory domain-containing protein [Candidatus Poribacteria bacterium]